MIQLSDLKLLGLHGHAGVGKDTVADYIFRTYEKVWAESFAGALKNACAEAFGIEREYFDDPSLKNTVIPYWGVTPRMIAQFVGTELFRENVGRLFQEHRSGNDFWIDRLEAKLTGKLPLFEGIYEPGDCVIVTDVRFQNEYDWLIANEGIVLHITRPGYTGAVGIPNHSSESSLNLHTAEATYHVNNDKDLDHLFAQVDAIIGDSLVRKPDDFPL